MSNEEKEVYEKKANADKERYAEEMRDYKSAVMKIHPMGGMGELQDDDGNGMHVVHVSFKHRK